MSLKETVLVTGASSGIGLEIARGFAREGSDVVLLSRSAEKLDQLADELRGEHQVQVHVVPFDLSRDDVATHIFEHIGNLGLAIDILVNNAGYGMRGNFAEIPLDVQINMLQVNTTALTALSRLFLPAMLERRRGGIIQLASTAAFQPGPGMAVYYASKAYVVSFSQALYEEARPYGVTVTCVAPGPTDTGFASRAHTDSRLVSRATFTTAADVAQASIKAFRNGKALVVPGLPNVVGAVLAKLAPTSLARKVVHVLNTKEVG